MKNGYINNRYLMNEFRYLCIVKKFNFIIWIKCDIIKLINEINKIEESEEHTRYYSMEDYGVKSDIFIPVEIDYTLPEIYVANDVFSYSYKEKEGLAERFFDTNIDYIREIEERNGSTIYENNQKILKLNTNGIVEYFSFEEVEFGRLAQYIIDSPSIEPFIKTCF